MQEQIASILMQQDVDLRLLIRDDGSDDSTHDIVQSMARDDPRIILFSGENLGVVGSFFALLAAEEAQSAAFVAFADHDDIWPADRLARQCAALAVLGTDKPGLCFGGFRRIDKDGVAIGEPVLPPMPDKAALLSENEVPGCTMMLNRAGHDIIRQNLPPAAHIYMHDWWVEQVIAYVGKIVRVDDVVLYYRQHDTNLIGAPGIGRMWYDRIVRIRKLRGRHPLPAQIVELHQRFGRLMAPLDRQRVEHFLKAATGRLWQRVPHVVHNDFRRARRSDDLFLRLLLLTGYFRSHVQ